MFIRRFVSSSFKGLRYYWMRNLLDRSPKRAIENGAGRNFPSAAVIVTVRMTRATSTASCLVRSVMSVAAGGRVALRSVVTLPSPPRGFSALAVSSSMIFAPPNSRGNLVRAAAGTLFDRSILIHPLCLSVLHHVDLSFNFGPPVNC